MAIHKARRGKQISNNILKSTQNELTAEAKITAVVVGCVAKVVGSSRLYQSFCSIDPPSWPDFR